MAGLKSIGMFTEFWKVTRELNPKGIEQEALQRFRIVITGDASVDLAWLHGELTRGRTGTEAVAVRPLSEGGATVEELPASDLYIYLARPGTRLSRSEADAIHRLDARGEPIIVVLSRQDDHLSDEEIKLGADLILGTIPLHRIAVVRHANATDLDRVLLPMVLDIVPHLTLGLARQLPRFRPFVAQHLIRETSRVNAEFALFSSIPANIPVVGTLVAVGADLMVLTKNQVMLLFKLAAIYDRNLAAKAALVAEIVPVVGAAFLWRSLARTIVQLMPGFVSAVPKTLIAAVGTYVVGRIALYYYEMNHRPDSRAVAQFRREALGQAGDLIADIQRRLKG